MKKETDSLNERIEAIQKELKFLGENYKFEYALIQRTSNKEIFCQSIIGSEEAYKLYQGMLSLNHYKFKERKRFDLITRMNNFRVICVDADFNKTNGYSNSFGRCEELVRGETYLVTNVKDVEGGLDFELEDLDGKALPQNYSSFRFVLDDYTKLN